MHARLNRCYTLLNRFCYMAYGCLGSDNLLISFKVIVAKMLGHSDQLRNPKFDRILLSFIQPCICLSPISLPNNITIIIFIIDNFYTDYTI